MQASTGGAERRLIWIGFLTVATLLATGVFACAIPFAALAALAALDTEHNDGPLLIGAVWLANQVYGFTVLGYPIEAQAIGWGLFMGVGAIAGYYAARAAVSALSPYGTVAMLLGSLLTAFLVYEAALFVGTLVLPRGEGAFNYDVMTYVSTVEVIAFIVLLIAHRVAVATGLIGRNAVERAV
jgi:hypothetical protein